MSIKDRTFKKISPIDEATTQADKKGGSAKDNKLKIVDPELAEIVLVKRNEMVEWQQRQK